jgi:NTP pyrophosphatase (non-canonical NTP hydrolase)
VAQGFWSGDMAKLARPYAAAIKLLLVTTEIAEAVEELRRGKEEPLREEMADIIIRTADLAGFLEIDLEKEISKKMAKNKTRSYKHGKAF